MNKRVDAIYEQGVFRPIQPVDLPDQALVQLHIRVGGTIVKVTDSVSDDSIPRQTDDMREFLEWVRNQSQEPTVPPFSAREHDKILYGWDK